MLLMRHALLKLLLCWVSAMVAADYAKAEKLSDVESERLRVLISDAEQARKNRDLDKTADLLSQAIAIKPDPSFRWNLARVYEELCMYPSAASQFKALASDTTIPGDVREQAKLRVRGLKRQTEAPSFRVSLRTPNAKLFVDGEETLTSQPGALFYSVKLNKHVFETFVPGNWRTRLRTAKPSTERCVTIHDDLDALPPTMARLRFDQKPSLSSLELNGYRVRADPNVLQELEVDPGRYSIEARTTTGKLLTARANVNAGEVRTIVFGAATGSAAHDMTAKNGTSEARKSVIGDRLDRLHKAVSSQSSTQIWGWITLGTGVALTGGGVALLAVAHSDFDQTNSNAMATQRTAFSEADAIDSSAEQSMILVGVGAAMTFTGLFLVLSDDEDSDQSVDHDQATSSKLTLFPGPGGSVHLNMSF